jgi:putative intracellular protease/amidase
MPKIAMTGRRRAGLGRLAKGLGGVGLAGASAAGAGAAGVAVSMRMAYPSPNTDPAEHELPPRPGPGGRRTVAVALGASGSVITDAFGPYEVFARSPEFFVYTVAARRVPAMLSGGLAVVPDYAFADVDADSAPAPDVVVVPAVVAPNGKKEAQLRQWIARQADRGAQVLGVCAGSRLLAASGVLDGRRATSHWSRIRDLERSRPQVKWVRGKRYIQDGNVTTTAGVTSGVFGALRLVEQLAGAAEAERVGHAIAYPSWSLDGPTDICAQRWGPRDLAPALSLLFPWFRPTVGVGLVQGVGELDVAAPFEVYPNSFAAHTIPIAAEGIVTTRHGLRLVATPASAATPRVSRLVVAGILHADQVDPDLADWAADRGLNLELPNGQTANQTADIRFSFDSMLADLAAHSDRATAQATAKSIEYPLDRLQLTGAAWPWRPSIILAVTFAAAIGLGLLPAAVVGWQQR